MHKLLATVASLLLYTCKAGSETTDTAVKADAKQANMYPYYYYPPVFYYTYYPPPLPAAEEGEQAEKAKPHKPFGGDRSDHWLYPPRSYYVHWADTEEQNDWDKWDKWGQWRGWYRRPTATAEPPH